MTRPAIKYISSYFSYPAIGAEVGVLEGLNALNILKCINIKRLYLIDPYFIYDGYDDKPILNLINSKTKDSAHHLLGDYKDKIIWIEKKFETIKLPESLDFIYIDGNHNYEYVLNDLNISEKIVKCGGIISGHDYYDNMFGVKKAVDKYCNDRRIKMYKNGIDWWFINPFKWRSCRNI